MRRRAALLVALAVAGMLLAACGGGGSLASQLQSWASGASYDADVAQLQSDLTSLAAGLSQRNLPALRTECEGFGVDAETLYGELPTPDETITDELGSSLQGFFTAARSCYDASSFTDSAFRSYQTTLRRSEQTYDRARNQLAAYGVR